MIERTVDLPVDEAYANLKASLLRKGCKILSEEPPTVLVVKQGSIWGTSPRTAKKLIRYSFASDQAGTQVSVSSSFSTDWKNLTLIGSVVAVVVLSLCLWISFDLEDFVASGQRSFWSWIATAGAYADFQVAQQFATIVRVFAVFLIVVMAIEAAVVAYCYHGLNGFADESLNLRA